MKNTLLNHDIMAYEHGDITFGEFDNVINALGASMACDTCDNTCEKCAYRSECAKNATYANMPIVTNGFYVASVTVERDYVEEFTEIEIEEED